ncbi:MAG: hypothetical protein J0L84_02770 [Verrucomicrobia bacterium]|nr:hypothetical protein [Verrucomicrobiota bacterium]
MSLSGTDWNPYQFTVAAFIITLVPACTSWWLVEKPRPKLNTRLPAPAAWRAVQSFPASQVEFQVILRL